MRLIDADKLLEETRKDRDYAEKNGFLDMYYERQVLIDRIESQPTAYDVAINALEQSPKMEQFAKWVATEIFDDIWEYNKDAFAEIACRKLAM